MNAHEQARALNRQRRRERERAWRAEAKQSAHMVQSSSAHIPPDVLDDRDRRADLLPRDLTAALQGDPLPGRSALDRLRAAASRE